MTTAVRSPFVLNDLALVQPTSVASPLMVVAPASKAQQAKVQLTEAVAELHRQSKELALVTSGTLAGLEKQTLQRVASTMRRKNLNDGSLYFLLPLAGTTVGLCLGIAATVTTGSRSAGMALMGAMGALSLVTPFVGGLVLKLADWQVRQASTRMIEVEQLDRPLKRLHSASGSAKAQVGVGLEKMVTSLSVDGGLAPESVAALSAAIADAHTVAVSDANLGKRTLELARLLTEPVTAELVEHVKQTLEAIPLPERDEVKEALREIVFADRKRVASIDFATRVALYQVLTGA